MANYAFKSPPVVEDGHTFRTDNFMQLVPHTALFAGVTGLTFIDCNLTNCDLPADAVVQGGTFLHISFCSHLHEFPGMALCDTECTHMTQKNEIFIDGVLVDTQYEYSDEVV